MSASKAQKPKGRPCSFDKEKALEAAMKVFWREGYEGASLTDLTRAMGINRPSLYAAFGDKDALFRKVLDQYEAGPAAPLRRALEAETAREAVEELLYGAVELTTDPENPHGCLAVQGALACSAGGEAVRKELTSRRDCREQLLRMRLERAQAEGDLGAEANAADLARYISTVMQGMAVQAASGASREELTRVVQTALRAWPG